MATLARFLYNDDMRFGLVADDKITPISGDYFGNREPAGDPIALDAVKLLAPIVPRQMRP
jgi:hypothetical protein